MKTFERIEFFALFFASSSEWLATETKTRNDKIECEETSVSDKVFEPVTVAKRRHRQPIAF